MFGSLRPHGDWESAFMEREFVEWVLSLPPEEQLRLIAAVLMAVQQLVSSPAWPGASASRGQCDRSPFAGPPSDQN